MGKKCIKLESLSAKEQELYNRLNENPNLPDFAGEVAMAYGAKDDLNGFLDEEEKTSRVNSIVLDCVRLMENQNESIAELSGMDSEGRLNALKGVLNVVRKNYAKRLNSFVEMFEKGENQKQIDTGLYRATRMLILLQNFDKLSEEAVLKIEKLSAIADTEIIEDELGEAESSDTDGDRIYDRSFDQESVVMKADKKIKLYLETRPKLVFKKDGSLAYQLNDLGLPEFQQADWLKTTLLEVLADSYDIKDMLAKLQQSEIPELQSVRNDLLNRGPIKPLLVEEGGVTYQVYNFQNAFFSAFNNTSYDFKQVLVTDVTNKEGNKVKKVMVFSPSKGGAVRGILKRWKGVKSAYKKEALRSNAQQVKDYLGKMDEKDPKQLFTVLKSAAKLVGGDITAKTWKSLTVGKKMDEIQKMIFGQSVSVTQLLDTILDNKDPFVEDSTLLRQLAKAELLANRGSSTGSFIDPKGNLRYPVNYHTAKTRIINELNNNRGRAVDPEHSIFDDPVLGKLEIMKWWDNDKNRIELSVFTALSDRDNDIDYSELDPVTSMATRLNLFINPDFQGRDNKNKAVIFTMTPADRTGTRMLTVPKLSGTTIGLHGASANVEAHAASIIEAELERIKLVEKENKENPEIAVKGYHKNGTSFQVFPWMNGILERRRQENNGVTPAIFDITEDQELMDEFMSGLIDVVADDFNHMIEEGFLEGFPGDKKRVPDVQLNDNIKKYFPGMEGLSNVEFKQKILDMLMTYYMVGTQISMVTEGDISYFKNLTDASKRAGLSDTPGRTLRIGVGGANRTYKVALCNEMVSASEFADEYEKFIGKEKADFYRNLEISDGSGFCSLDRYADIMKGLGKYTPEMHRTIMELKKENPDFSKITEVLQPIKGFSHGNRYSEAHGRYMHKNQKYALMPLYKHMAKGDERLTKIVNKMESEGVDELIFGSATKLGGFQFNDVEQENAWALTEYSNEDFRIPTDFTYKEKLEDNDGSQFRKLQIGNIDPDTEYTINGKTITGEEWVREHEDIISNNIMQSNRELLTALIDNQGNYSIEKISKLLKKKLEGGSFEATSSELQDALDLVEFVYNNNERIRDTKIPLTFPTISDKVSKAILSLFQKEVVKQKVPGMSVLQQAAIGDQKLKFVRMSEDGKTVLPAEVQVTPQYFVKGLKMTLQSLKRKLTKSSDPKEIAELTESIKELSQVITDIRSGKGLNKIPKELREVIAYRIPTQARNSSVPCIIKEFLPITSGTAMVLPAELVAQSGADYDGDKLFLQMKTYGFDTKSNKIRTIKSENNTEVSKRGRSKRSNRLFDLRYSMLTNPAHFTELITPNHADTLREVLAKEDTTKTPADSFWGSLKMQDTLRSRNQAGGKMIGISSIANTFHALMQHMKSSYSQSANTRFNGVSSNNLGNKFNNKRSKPIDLSRTSSLGYNSAAPLNVAVQNKQTSNAKFLNDVALQVISSKKSLKGKSANQVSRFYTKFFKDAFIDALNDNLTEAELIELANTGNAVLEESGMNTVVAGYYEALMYIRSNMYSNAVDGVYETVTEEGSLQISIKTDYYNEELISDEFMQEQTASVDNAKEPLLGGLNINEYTAAAYTFLLEAGLGSRYSAELTRSKPVKDLVAEARLEVLKGTDPRNAIDAAYTSIMNSPRYRGQSYKLDELTFSDADITLEELETLDRSQHLMALRTFMKAHKLGSAYTSEVQAKLHDTKGVKSDLAKAVGRATTVGSTEVIPESLKDRDKSVSEKLVNLYNKPGKNLSVDSYLQQGLEGALNVVNDLAIKDNVIGEGALIYNNYMQLLTSVYKAPTQNTLGFHKEEAVFATIADKESPVKKYLTPEKELQMRFGQNSLARRVVKAQIAENNKLAKNANHQPNRFLMSLMAEIPTQQLDEHKVVFDNSVVSRGGSIDLKDQLVKGFNDLYSNKETRMLAIDLFMYGIAVHGIGSKSYQSYMDYVPNDLYLKSIKKSGSIVELFEKTVTEEEGGKGTTNSFIEFSQTMNTLGGQMLSSMLAKHSKAMGIKNIDVEFNTAVDAQKPLYDIFRTRDGQFVEKTSSGVTQVVKVSADNEAKSISFEYVTDLTENMSLWSNVNKELNSNSLEDLHKKLTASGIVKDNNDPSCGI